MKGLIVFMFLVNVGLANAQYIVQGNPQQELIEEERVGLCEVCHQDTKGDLVYKNIPCEWKRSTPLEVLDKGLEPRLTNYEEHYINKRFDEILRRDVDIELRSYFTSAASEITNECLAEDKSSCGGEISYG